MSVYDEAHYCWQQCCDLGPHSCICGNDCPPDRFPLTLDELRDWWLSGYHEGYETEEAEALFDRWLAEHEKQVRAEERDRIAKAIEARRDNFCVVTDTPTTHPTARAYADAARIAREADHD